MSSKSTNAGDEDEDGDDDVALALGLGGETEPMSVDGGKFGSVAVECVCAWGSMWALCIVERRARGGGGDGEECGRRRRRRRGALMQLRTGGAGGEGEGRAVERRTVFILALGDRRIPIAVRIAAPAVSAAVGGILTSDSMKYTK